MSRHMDEEMEQMKRRITQLERTCASLVAALDVAGGSIHNLNSAVSSHSTALRSIDKGIGAMSAAVRKSTEVPLLSELLRKDEGPGEAH